MRVAALAEHRDFGGVAMEHVMTALARTCRVSKDHAAVVRRTVVDDGRFMALWNERTVRSIDQLKPVNVARLIYALGVVGCLPNAYWMCRWYQEARTRLHDMDGRLLSWIVYGLGLLHQSDGLRPNPLFLRVWSETAVTRIDTFNAQGLANCIYGFAKMKTKPTQSFLAGWFQRAQDVVPQSAPQGLSTMLYSLSKLNCRLPDAFATQYRKEVINKWKQLPPTAVVNIVSGLTSFPDSQRQEFVEALVGDGKSLLTKMSDLELSRLLNGLARSKIDVHELFLANWSTEFQRRMERNRPSFAVETLASCIHSFALIQRRPTEEFLETFHGMLRRRVSHFGPRELSTVMYSMCNLGIELDPRWLHLWVLRAEEIMETFSDEWLVSILYALAESKSVSTPSIYEEWKRCIMPRLGDIAASQCAKICYSLGVLQQRLLPAFWDGIFQRIVQIKAELQPLDIALILSGLSKLKIRGFPYLHSVLWSVIDEQLDNFDQKTSTSCLISSMHLAFPMPSHVRDLLKSRVHGFECGAVAVGQSLLKEGCKENFKESQGIKSTGSTVVQERVY
uniref:Uncharacterized protein n=1 Tax=Compsopogon caeruleus TaxID=31354 RepID=A0A7S1XC69_9RHOD